MILPSERQENKENTGTLTRRKSLRTADIEKKELRINLVDFDAKKNNNATDLVKELEKLSTGMWAGYWHNKKKENQIKLYFRS